MSYAYQGYNRKTRSNKIAGIRGVPNKIKAKSKQDRDIEAGGGEGEQAGATKGSGEPMTGKSLGLALGATKAIGNAIAPGLGNLMAKGVETANQKAMAAHNATDQGPGLGADSESGVQGADYGGDDPDGSNPGRGFGGPGGGSSSSGSGPGAPSGGSGTGGAPGGSAAGGI